MTKYTCCIGIENNIDIDGYIDINYKQLNSLCDSTVVLILGDMSENAVYSAYKALINLKNRGNNIFIISVGEINANVKKILALAVSKQVYGIFRADSTEDIDIEYLETLEGHGKSTIVDIRNFIGEDVTYYAEIGDIINNILELAMNDNDFELVKQVTNNAEVLAGCAHYNNFLIGVHNRLAAELVSLNTKLEEAAGGAQLDVSSGADVEFVETLKNENIDLQKKISDISAELTEKTKALEENQEIIIDIKRSNMTLNEQNKELTARLNEKGPTISSYQKISLQSPMVKCRCKAVFYFKEVSYVRYVNSFILSMLKLMSVQQKRAKLVIYDSKSDFSVIYKPLNIIGTNEYMVNRDRYLNSSPAFVVIEPNQVIIEDVLKQELDVLIIYDRMKLSKDIIEGNNVHKYWVVNSLAHINALKPTGIMEKYCITRPNVLPGTIGIAEIRDYRQATDNGKLSKYCSLKNTNDPDNASLPIMQTILERANIKLTTGRHSS